MNKKKKSKVERSKNERGNMEKHIEGGWGGVENRRLHLGGKMDEAKNKNKRRKKML